MSTIRVWVRVNQPGRNAVSIRVTEGSLIDDMIQAAISVEKLNTPPGAVTVNFGAEKLCLDAAIIQYNNTLAVDNTPLLEEVDGTLHAVMYVLLKDLVPQ